MPIELGLGVRPAARRVKRDAEWVRRRRGRLGVAGVREVAAREMMHWPPVQRAVGGAYHRLCYYNPRRTWRDTRWLGHEVWKFPLDLWIYQEIVHEVRPRLIVETGTRFGGTTVFLAHLLDLMEADGRIVSVDINAGAQPPHPRITYLDGSSTDPAIVERVRSSAADGGPVLVILDSDHRTPHVRDEITAYAELVTPGSYLIVEDTNTGGHPVQHPEVPDGGPMTAVEELLARDERFEVDRRRERFWVTNNPSGYLQRVS
jgi:cephalosporin hydroxylase